MNFPPAALTDFLFVAFFSARINCLYLKYHGSRGLYALCDSYNRSLLL
jgi:hypothetical protein